MSGLVNGTHRSRGLERNRPSGLVLFSWYFFFGAIHELSHYVTAWWMGYDFALQHIDDDINVFEGGRRTDPWLHLAYEVILGRQCSLPNLPLGLEGPVRHAGWIFSCALLVLLTAYCRHFKQSNSRVIPDNGNEDKNIERQTSFFNELISNTMLLAALVTAVEAVATDFLGFDQVLPLNVKTVRQTFYCGNFGVILLNRCWFDSKKSQGNALDTLQQMVEVTMMRGAQSGGVVFYQPNKKEEKSDCGAICSKAIRSRVVNRKRTDLSKLVRSKVEKDLRKNMVTQTAGTFVPRMLVGHTRFATSSLSTLDGTHPHQWTPPSQRRVYSMDGSPRMVPQATVVSVENYITHNGDFDFYVSRGKTYELETIQNWLSVVTETKTPAPVDSCAIAGMVDILRTQGSFGLSARYALVLGMKSSRCGLNAKLAPTDEQQRSVVPPYKEFLEGVVGVAFERVLEEYCKSFEQTNEPIPTLREIASSKEYRVALQRKSFDELKKLPTESLEILQRALNSNQNDMGFPLQEMVVGAPRKSVIVITEDDSSKNVSATSVHDQVERAVVDDVESNFVGSDLGAFCKHTINAFFDNDLFMTTKIFMQNAKGSFGLSVTSNLDSHRQMCLAARGQTISIAFYPSKDLICYGSEQAAVKAGMGAEFPEAWDDDDFQTVSFQDTKYREVDGESTRLDLDDLGGEIVVLDWGRKRYQTAPVSHPNQHLEEFQLMKGKITAVLYQESKSTKKELFNRMTRLSDNPLIQPLQKSPEDPVLADIREIPYVCKVIQDDWQSRRASSSLNRLTAFNLSRCLRKRLEQHANGTVPNMSVDILLTGCEVSLYVAEQFASDLKKAFPKLSIEAVSSNKLLGLYGQEIAVPSIGFQYAPQTRNIHDSIVIIVSHSGGTFGPLACSNLLQSATQNIFVVTSEWDTQIGKQLRMIDEINGNEGNMMHQRIFSTGVGIRPAEPCSISVAATHQLLTNLFQYMSVIVLSDPRFRRATKAQINEQDIQILERCSLMNINALTDIVGYNMFGYALDRTSSLLNNLHELGNLWADHILEQARAYIMSFLYVFITVTSGWPLVSAIGHAFGVADGDRITYFLRFLDSCIYFWLPQICITMIRVFQGRNLRHRMVGRTVVIGDIPWVSNHGEVL